MITKQMIVCCDIYLMRKLENTLTIYIQILLLSHNILNLNLYSDGFTIYT